MARKQSNPSNFNKPFPSALRALMEERKTSQKELADHLGKTRQAISLYCNGESAPDLEALVKIAKFFDTSTDYLLGLYPYPHKELSAVDELGLSPDTVEKIKRSKNWCEEDFADTLPNPDDCSRIADFTSCHFGHGALNLLINSTLDDIVYTQISLLARRITKLSETEIPEHLIAHQELRARLGGAANDISAGVKLSFELYDKYPDLTGLFQVQFGLKSLKIELDDICDTFRRHIEEITGYRAFAEKWMNGGRYTHVND